MSSKYCIALAYWFQPSPFARNPAEAAPWHAAAAQQDHTGALVALGYQYERGQGVGLNPAKAVHPDSDQIRKLGITEIPVN
jgi:TPR repeat protein